MSTFPFPSMRQRFQTIGFTVETGVRDNQGQIWRYRVRKGGIVEYYSGPGAMLSALKRWEIAIANAQ